MEEQILTSIMVLENTTAKCHKVNFLTIKANING